MARLSTWFRVKGSEIRDEAGGIVNARSGVPINVLITRRSDTASVGGATVINIPGGNQRVHSDPTSCRASTRI